MKLNLTEAFSRFSDHWSPRIAAELNGEHVKLVKFKGAFDWHHHEQEDEMFLVHRGSFVMEFRDKRVELAAEEVEVMRFTSSRCPKRYLHLLHLLQHPSKAGKLRTVERRGMSENQCEAPKPYGKYIIIASAGC